MQEDPYTHYFKFEVDDYFINGECEFDTDGKSTINVKEWSNPLDVEVVRDFDKFIKKLVELNDKYKNKNDIKRSGIKRIVIKLKK